MGITAKIGFGLAVLFGLVASPCARAQEPLPPPDLPPPDAVAPPPPVRVIEQDLLVTDPTVAARQRWLVGVGVEGWYTVLPGWPYVDFLSNTVKRSEEHTSELQSLRHLVCRL